MLESMIGQVVMSLHRFLLSSPSTSNNGNRVSQDSENFCGLTVPYDTATHNSGTCSLVEFQARIKVFILKGVAICRRFIQFEACSQ